MAKEQTSPAEIKETEPALTESSQKETTGPRPARVSRKIDMNTVEVQFDKPDRGKKFEVFDAGVLKGSGEFPERGDVDTQIVPLTDYLRKGVLHEFSVVVK